MRVGRLIEFPFRYYAGGRTYGRGELPTLTPTHMRHMLGPMLRGLPLQERHVKLFKNGRNQAVRIPREFELPGEDAIMRKEGARLIIEPILPKSLLAVLAGLTPLDEDFPPMPDFPPKPIRF